jgi:hypothetical protein
MRGTTGKILSVCAAILALTAAANGSTLKVREGRPILDGVYVDGHGPYRFLLDTGSNINLIESKLASSIALVSTYQVALATSGGSTSLRGAEGQHIRVDSAEADGQMILISDLQEIKQAFPDVQGVLGQFFLSRFDYFLDLRGRRFEIGKHDVDGVRVPIEWLNGRPAVATSLGRMILDSGAAQVTLFGIEPDKKPYTWNTVSGSQDVGVISGRTLRIEDRTIWKGEAVAIPRPREGEADIAGLLPLSVFKTVYVCNSDGYAVLD